jgi:7,8-dihydro-6-hydroxymethylpterin dimethyltransferase
MACIPCKTSASLPTHGSMIDASQTLDAARPLREALQRQGLWSPHQTAARRWPIGCVSLEVTQRCNLDCTLCYLSEHSEAMRDVPLEELLRRIDMIFERYGAGTDIQISGGDPTLRDADELVQIVTYIATRGMRSSLFTNGILASRKLLQRLAKAGLCDVAFHVDMTQQRQGYRDEESLNALRREYIERARGLGLSVFFNTSIFDDNLQDVPMLARFFTEHSDVVQLVSFQMQAHTGRGVLGGRAQDLTQERMMRLLELGCGTPLNWDALMGGHPSCNRYATALVLRSGAASRAHDLFRDGEFIARVMRETAQVRVERGKPWRAAWTWVRAVLSRPGLLLPGVIWLLALLRRVRADWVGLPQARKISFFIHNFMDAKHLEADRLDACVFMAATADGLMPMCEYNAKRDDYLLKPLKLSDGSQWQPLLAPERELARTPGLVLSDAQGLVRYPIKFLKGRSRQAALRERHASRVKS